MQITYNSNLGKTFHIKRKTFLLIFQQLNPSPANPKSASMADSGIGATCTPMHFAHPIHFIVAISTYRLRSAVDNRHITKGLFPW